MLGACVYSNSFSFHLFFLLICNIHPLLVVPPLLTFTAFSSDTFSSHPSFLLSFVYFLFRCISLPGISFCVFFFPPSLLLHQHCQWSRCPLDYRDMSPTFEPHLSDFVSVLIGFTDWWTSALTLTPALRDFLTLQLSRRHNENRRGPTLHRLLQVIHLLPATCLGVCCCCCLIGCSGITIGRHSFTDQR